MAEKFKNQADGGDGKEGAPDGVNDAKQGSGGESNGGAYPNPHDQTNTEGRDLPHGGQSDIAYHGPGHLGDEAVGKDEGRKARD